MKRKINSFALITTLIMIFMFFSEQFILGKRLDWMLANAMLAIIFSQFIIRYD